MPPTPQPLFHRCSAALVLRRSAPNRRPFGRRMRYKHSTKSLVPSHPFPHAIPMIPTSPAQHGLSIPIWHPHTTAAASTCPPRLEGSLGGSLPPERRGPPPRPPGHDGARHGDTGEVGGDGLLGGGGQDGVEVGGETHIHLRVFRRHRPGMKSRTRDACGKGRIGRRDSMVQGRHCSPWVATKGRD